MVTKMYTGSLFETIEPEVSKINYVFTHFCNLQAPYVKTDYLKQHLDKLLQHYEERIPLIIIEDFNLHIPHNKNLAFCEFISSQYKGT